MLNKNDLCHKFEDLELWFVFAQNDSLVEGNLTEELVKIIDGKDIICDEVRKEINDVLVLKHNQSSINYNDQKIEEMLKKLMDPNLILNHNNSFDDEEIEFRISPILMEFLKSKSLSEFKTYYENCVKASIILQNDPKKYLKVVSKLIPGIVPNKNELIRELNCSRGTFEKKLKKYRLISNYKMNQTDCLSELESLIEITDYDWILKDDIIKDLFDPLNEEKIDLNKLLLKIITEIQASREELLFPYSKKFMKITLEHLNMKKEESNDTFEKLFEQIPMVISELFDLIRNVPSLVSPFSLQILSLSLGIY